MMAEHADRYPATPDGRYFVVRGRLWRKSNPALNEQTRQQLVKDLMSARRDVRAAKGDTAALARARRRVDDAKVALGERGPVWWNDGEPDFNRHLVKIRPMPRGLHGFESWAICDQPRLEWSVVCFATEWFANTPDQPCRTARYGRSVFPSLRLT